MDTKSERICLRRLLRNLSRELFQTETSASLHCRREAKRLGDAPPSRVLHDVAQHADAVLGELPPLCGRYDLPVSQPGMAIGALFSALRERFADHLIERERSYRGTLLGMRHGVDVVLLLRHAAEQQGYSDLVQFCERWLSSRVPLVSAAEEQLVWFARHSDTALEFARPTPVVDRLRQSSTIGMR
jgi:hypothetical protein